MEEEKSVAGISDMPYKARADVIDTFVPIPPDDPRGPPTKLVSEHINALRPIQNFDTHSLPPGTQVVVDEYMPFENEGAGSIAGVAQRHLRFRHGEPPISTLSMQVPPNRSITHIVLAEDGRVRARSGVETNKSLTEGLSEKTGFVLKTRVIGPSSPPATTHTNNVSNPKVKALPPDPTLQDCYLHCTKPATPFSLLRETPDSAVSAKAIITAGFFGSLNMAVGAGIGATALKQHQLSMTITMFAISAAGFFAVIFLLHHLRSNKKYKQHFDKAEQQKANKLSTSTNFAILAGACFGAIPALLYADKMYAAFLPIVPVIAIPGIFGILALAVSIANQFDSQVAVQPKSEAKK